MEDCEEIIEYVETEDCEEIIDYVEENIFGEIVVGEDGQYYVAFDKNSPDIGRKNLFGNIFF